MLRHALRVPAHVGQSGLPLCSLSNEEEHTELTARSEAAEEAVVAPLFGRLPFLKRAPPLRMAKGSMSS